VIGTKKLFNSSGNRHYSIHDLLLLWCHGYECVTGRMCMSHGTYITHSCQRNLIFAHMTHTCHDSFMGIMYGCVTGRMSMNDSLSDCDIDSHVRAIGVALAQ